MFEHDAWEDKLAGQPSRVLRCDQWEGLLADALDGTMASGDAAAFARHHQECPLCAQMLKETRQGQAWMEYLQAEPEMPAGLLEKILARTSERQDQGAAVPPRAVPARPAWYRLALPVVRQFLEPRLMMTAAMAFFSIALTLNLAGIRLSQVRPSDLRPSRLRANLTRQYYSANEQVMKYYENLRLVYEMEARVRELRRSTEAEPPAAPRETPKPAPRDGTGSPSSTAPKVRQIPPRPSPLHGDAALPALMVHALPQHFYLPPASRQRPPQAATGFAGAGREVFRVLRRTTEDQAERSLA